MTSTHTLDFDDLGALQTSTSADDRGLAATVHVATLAAHLLTAGLLHVVVPAVALVVLKDRGAWLRQHVKEQLNFQLTYMVVAALVGVFVAVTLGLGVVLALPLLFAYFLVDVVCSIKAALAATRGDTYRFPWSIRFVG